MTFNFFLALEFITTEVIVKKMAVVLQDSWLICEKNLIVFRWSDEDLC